MSSCIYFELDNEMYINLIQNRKINNNKKYIKNGNTKKKLSRIVVYV